MRPLALALAVLLGSTARARAGQPISTNLTECSEIFSFMAMQVRARSSRTTDEIVRVRRLSAVFAASAVDQAGREGVEVLRHIS
ncbi:MAG: hypothetical protein AAF666_14160, partial [Pseudomonadota bacterium]